MSFYGVCIEGSGFEMSIDDGSVARGFVVWRHVRAVSPESAVADAMDIVRGTPRLSSIRTSMKLRMVETKQIAALPEVEPGFAFYEEE